jgi:RNA polymerase sigma factor (sigma-70 family)
MTSPEFTPSIELSSDAELVAACVGGDRNAFGQVVQRYQRLLCSLAYSRTGSITESEDIAQEAFLTAWRELPQLREPDKLRPWLCGILRHKVGRLRRTDAREPSRQSDSLDAAHDLSSSDEPAVDLAMRNEEQAMLWSALERVPELYREPLVLFYREHQSIEHVASALELTEDAVKQRLARGRKILQEQVMAFVEGALRRSTPGRVFTLGVLAALPELVTPAKAVGFGAAAAAHGSVLAKTTTAAALLASISGTVAGVLALRANLDQARTPLERRAVVKVTLAAFAGAFGFLGLLYLLRAAAFQWWESRVIFAVLCQLLVIVSAMAWPICLLRAMRANRILRTSERQKHPELFNNPVYRAGSPVGEYRSAMTLFGVPLVHVRFSSPDEGEKPVFGWFAGGDRAYGLLFAWGGYTVAPISVGAISIGFFALGSLSIGVFSIGTLSLGYVVVGCASIGVTAFGWLSAMGWYSAQCGGFALARIAAEGPIAFAQHANDAAARLLVANPDPERSYMFVYIIISVLTLVPISAYARAVRQRYGAHGKS